MQTYLDKTDIEHENVEIYTNSHFSGFALLMTFCLLLLNMVLPTT